MNRSSLLLILCATALAAACGGGRRESAAGPQGKSAYRIYVTNESSGDLSVIDAANHEVVATLPLGKRPRGIHASPDRRTIYVALSGSSLVPLTSKH